MKKTLLATAIVSALVASTAASAATVYDKDGTTLKVNARIEAQWYNAGSSMNYSGEKAPGNNDSSIYNWARMGLDGRSKINNYMTAFGYMEFDVDDGDVTSDGLGARDQYIGVDFGAFGAVKTGRYKSLLNQVVSATDVLAGDGESGKTFVVGDSRNAGKLTYTWNGYGILLGAEYQSAKDGYTDHKISMNVESGYNVIAGYTTPSVLFGPISIKAGYSFMRGQNDGLPAVSAVGGRENADNAKGWAASLAWGNPASGWYFAGEYSYAEAKYIFEGYNDDINYNNSGYEIIGKYSFANGLSLATGYQYERGEAGDETVKSSQIPVVAEYNFNPNFKVYAQANFGVSNTVNESDGKIIRIVGSAPTYGDGNAFALGARYTF